ncbi:MAG: formyl-coenzyme transferase [Mycobacterium sp.]|jgi:formyl-CoA transferase|nr:formyl-coenzyme transferase [Mycobacterium sp.]
MITNTLGPPAPTVETVELTDGFHLVVDWFAMIQISGSSERPIKFPGFTPTITGAPMRGERSDEILTVLGYDSQRISALHEAAVVVGS